MNKETINAASAKNDAFISRAWSGFKNAEGDDIISPEELRYLHRTQYSSVPFEKFSAVYPAYLAAKQQGFKGSFEDFQHRSIALGFLEKGFGVISNLFAAPASNSAPYTAPVPQKESNTGLIVGVVIAVLVVGGGIGFAVWKSKQDK